MRVMSVPRDGAVLRQLGHVSPWLSQPNVTSGARSVIKPRRSSLAGSRRPRTTLRTRRLRHPGHEHPGQRRQAAAPVHYRGAIRDVVLPLGDPCNLRRRVVRPMGTKKNKTVLPKLLMDLKRFGRRSLPCIAIDDDSERTRSTPPVRKLPEDMADRTRINGLDLSRWHCSCVSPPWVARVTAPGRHGTPAPPRSWARAGAPGAEHAGHARGAPTGRGGPWYDRPAPTAGAEAAPRRRRLQARAVAKRKPVSGGRHTQ